MRLNLKDRGINGEPPVSHQTGGSFRPSSFPLVAQAPLHVRGLS